MKKESHSWLVFNAKSDRGLCLALVLGLFYYVWLTRRKALSYRKVFSFPFFGKQYPNTKWSLWLVSYTELKKYFHFCINKTESKFSPRPQANPFCNLFKSIQLLPVLYAPSTIKLDLQSIQNFSNENKKKRRFSNFGASLTR